MEIDIVALSGELRGGARHYCAKLQGRVVRNNQHFAAVDAVAERCDDERAAEGGSDPVSLLVMAMNTLDLEGGTPRGAGLLYVQALEQLVDDLGRRASVRQSAAGSAVK